MRATKRSGVLALAVASLLATGCILIPEIEEKIVELAVGGSATVGFESLGDLNTLDGTQTIDIGNTVDVAKILDDAGIDVSNVKDIALSGVSCRVTQTDPTPNRRIENGTVTIQRTSGPVTTLVSDFDLDVNSATSWQTATLEPAGVAVVNALLDDLLAELKGGPDADTQITYHVIGQSLPGDVPTDFKWELKVDVSILGTVEVDVVE